MKDLYNQPTTYLGFDAFGNMLKPLPPDRQLLPMLCTTDSNLHSPLWNPYHSTTNDKYADRLIEMMLEWGLNLRSPKGKPTFGLDSSTTKGTSIDLVWVNTDFDDTIVMCFINDNDLTNHGSDHQSIITIFSKKARDLPGTHPDAGERRNWNKVCHLPLRTKVAQTLPAIRPLLLREDIKSFDLELREALKRALDKHSPRKAKMGKHKDWWRPEVLEPRRRRLLKKLKTKEARTAYRAEQNTFNQAVDHAKESSWRSYLSGLDHQTLFQAKRAASGRKPSSLVSTIITDTGETCATNEEKAAALFNAMCFATARCQLDNTSTITFPIDASHRPTPERTPAFDEAINLEAVGMVVSDSPPVKAPGPDRIQNWIWKAVWDQVKRHVTILFQCIALTGIIPRAWKTAVTVMIPKPGKADYTQALAYRPIALLNRLGNSSRSSSRSTSRHRPNTFTSSTKATTGGGPTALAWRRSHTLSPGLRDSGRKVKL